MEDMDSDTGHNKTQTRGLYWVPINATEIHKNTTTTTTMKRINKHVYMGKRDI